MFTLIAENESGKQLKLTQNPNFSVTNIDGLNPPSATINAANVAGFDGQQFNSARVNTRNIVINIVINPDIDTNRLKLYEIFRTKQYIKLYFKNDVRNVFIEGRIETIECNLFAMRQSMQISIICFQPYFCESDSHSFVTRTTNLLEFPVEFPKEGIEFGRINDESSLNVINAGEVETGMFIVLKAVGGDVYKPAIYNAITGEKLELSITTFTDGSIIWINTNKGERSITLIQNGFGSNAINYLTNDSTWLQLHLGANQFTYDTWLGTEFLEMEIIFNNKYQGV